MSFLKLVSRSFGWVANVRFYKNIQVWLNKSYVNHFQINMSEFEDISSYKSLNELFTRRLREPRALDEGFISPCDGELIAKGSSFGPENEHLAFSIKQNSYDIKALLGPSYKDAELEGGLMYANIYLSPKDYHRYHAPFDIQILSATYIPAQLYSVSKATLCKIANLYVKNERVILRCLIDKKLLWLVFVGATNVGKMRFSFDDSIQTNAKIDNIFTHDYSDLELKKGVELGNFELGSTILILAQKGLLEFCDLEKVRFGQKIAKLL